jgi:hypothetical protein
VFCWFIAVAEAILFMVFNGSMPIVEMGGVGSIPTE